MTGKGLIPQRPREKPIAERATSEKPCLFLAERHESVEVARAVVL
jgi:hypothetical protein